MFRSTSFASKPAEATRIVATGTAVPTSPRPKKSALRSLLEVACGALIAASIFSACAGPCEELADKICDCELSASAQNQCSEQVRSAMQLREPTDAENLACEAKLMTCTCEALEADDLSACGLSKE